MIKPLASDDAWWRHQITQSTFNIAWSNSDSSSTRSCGIFVMTTSLKILKISITGCVGKLRLQQTAITPRGNGLKNWINVAWVVDRSSRASQYQFGWVIKTREQTKFMFSPKRQFMPTESPVDLTTHYKDVIMSVMASQLTSITIIYSTVYSGVDQRKHQSSASLAFMRGIHLWPVNSLHKRPVTRKMFSFDDAIILSSTFSRFHF